VPPRAVGGNIASSAAVASGSDTCQSVSMDFIFGLPPDHLGRSGAVVFVDRPSKMVHLAAVKASASAEDIVELFLHIVFRHHGLSDTIVSDRDPRFTSVLSILRRMAASELRSVVQKVVVVPPVGGVCVQQRRLPPFPRPIQTTRAIRVQQQRSVLRSVSLRLVEEEPRGQQTSRRSSTTHRPTVERRQ